MLEISFLAAFGILWVCQISWWNMEIYLVGSGWRSCNCHFQSFWHFSKAFLRLKIFTISHFSHLLIYFKTPQKIFKIKFSTILCIFPVSFWTENETLWFFSVENRHGEDHLLREEGKERSSFTENHIFFVIFSCLFLDPFKCLKCGKFTEFSWQNP